MNNWGKIAIGFILSIFASVFLFVLGLKNFCFSSSFLSSDCSGKTPVLFFLGLIFPFVIFPFLALLLFVFSPERSKLQNYVLILFALFPFILFGLIYVSQWFASPAGDVIRCFSFNRKVEREMENTPAPFTVKEISLISEDNLAKNYRIVIETNNLPLTFDSYYFEIYRFADSPNDSDKDNIYTISSNGNSIVIKRINNELTFLESKFNKSVKLSGNSFFVEMSISKRFASSQVPQKAKFLIFVRDSNSTCQKRLDFWVDIPPTK